MDTNIECASQTHLLHILFEFHCVAETGTEKKYMLIQSLVLEF